MLHSSGPNPSGRPRRGAVFQYRADDAFQLADGVWKDTGIMIWEGYFATEVNLSNGFQWIKE